MSKPAKGPAGGLVLVSTPIGNLGDLSPRAVETLKCADLICCEDTRRTRELLAHTGLKGKHLISLHAHNEASRIPQVVEQLQAGKTVALVSDAGTPSISDPGERLVAGALAAGIRVSAVPGPSAALAALVASGFRADRFCFEGFLPRKGAERKRRLREIGSETRTVILYEAPGRVVGTLADLEVACGSERLVAVARELTKLHEETWRGTLGEAVARYGSAAPRGEVVLVLGGAKGAAEVSDEQLTESLRRRLAAGDSAREAAAVVASESGVSRRRVYQLALSVRDDLAGG